MDYYIFADGSYEAVPAMAMLQDMDEMRKTLGAIRIVWLNNRNNGSWSELVRDTGGIVTRTDVSVPDVIKLAQMLE